MDREKCSTESIAMRIKQLRTDAGISQKELTDMLHFVSRSTVTNIESGVRGLTINAAIEYAELFDVTIDWILTGEDKMVEFESDETKEMLDVFTSLKSAELKKAAIEQVRVLKKMLG